jgi:hypothetical protein
MACLHIRPHPTPIQILFDGLHWHLSKKSATMSKRRLSCAAIMPLLLLLLFGTTTAQENYTSDIVFKEKNLEWNEIELNPGQCDGSHQYCIDIPNVNDGETADSLSQKFRSHYPHFSEAWMNHISADVREKFDDYVSSNQVGIKAYGNSSTISTYSFGVAIDNFYGLDYLNNKFMVRRERHLFEVILS